MKQILQHTLVLCGSLLALAGCSTEELATEPISGKPATLVATIGSNTNTRTGHAEDAPNGVKVTWIANDVINLYSGTPSASNLPVAFVCESIDGTTGAGTFGSEQTPANTGPYFAHYPATLTHDLKLSMLGQTQASNESMAHLGTYDAMRTETNDWKRVDFTAASSSAGSTSAHLASLITFDLQNLPLTLGVPQKITLGCIDGSGNAAAVFKGTLNDATSATSSLSLVLGDGFTDITEGSNSIKAYLMVAPATIPVGHKLTIAVEGSLANYLFTSEAVKTEIKYVAGKRHTATVMEALSWEKPFSGSTYTGAETKVEFTTGDGSVDKPYEIATAGQLRKLIEGAKYSSNNGYKDKYFKLTTDIRIAMANGNNWTPIGDKDNKFKGTFDGNGHTISGTMMDSTVGYFGFFGYTSGATISNLTVDATVSGSDWYVGGIVGYASTTHISNCTNKRAVTGTYNRVGGIAGYAESCTISNCTNKGAVTSKFGEVGGIVGFAKSGSIIACYNTATVTASSPTSSTHSGGIAGKLDFYSVVTACYNTGRIIIVENSIGAITGENPSDCTVSYCQWVLDDANEGLSAFPSGGSTSKENTKRDDLATLNIAGVTALNTGIKEWNTANAATPAKHCPFHFVAGTAGTGPTLAAGVPE